MFSIRKVKTKSGSTAIQVVQYVGHRCNIAKHIGSAKNDLEIRILYRKALDWIDNETCQTSLFPNEKQRILVVDRSECIGVTHQFAYQFFSNCVKECGLSYLPPLLIDLAIMRLIEPTSKQRAVKLLSDYFNIVYSQRIYRNIPKLSILQADIERSAYQVAVDTFNEPFYFVLYDVTTLYFESFKADEFKIQGFSKDNKSQQPQIVIGLLTTQSGFPIAYQVFAGNTFEGKTMLPIVKRFIQRHPDTKPIIVADAAMLDQDRLIELRNNGLSYIVGARLANANLKLIKQIHDTLCERNGAIARFHSPHGFLICQFSSKRFTKELNELNKLILKAEEMVARQSTGTKTKFVRRISKEKIELNTDLIEKRKLLLGIKGYCTDISEQNMSNELAISRYHQLWHIEQSFRMSKYDLQARPIFHQKQQAINAHILICFVSLMIEKYLELTTKMSLRDIRYLVWNITESNIKDTLTKETFTFRSPTDKLMESALGGLVKKWQMLPH